MWEYLIRPRNELHSRLPEPPRPHPPGGGQLSEILNAYGSLGWELASTMIESGMVIFIFKRRIA